MITLNLSKPLCFFDLETTGINIAKDRIVEIAVLKIKVNNEKESKTWLINPEMSIPPAVTAVHGISNEKVADCPTFKQLGKEIYNFISGCDLAGYNSDRFDIPLLAEEFMRAEIDFELTNFKTIDVQTIFHKMEKRTLEAALQFYCKKELKDAHTAMADTVATYEVLLGQLERYEELENDVNFLNTFSSHRKSIDLAGFIGCGEEDIPIFNFGKYKGTAVEEVFRTNPGYYSWIQNADFPLYTKKVLTKIRLGMNN